jgi:hypothetical protein
MDKQELLNMQMNQLGLGGAFNRWFTIYGLGQKTEKQDILTLRDFIGVNPGLKTNKEVFFCYKREGSRLMEWPGFIKDSKSFKKLRQFLLDNEFTYKDWILLLPDVDTPKGKRPDYSLLDKKTLLDQFVSRITGVKGACEPVQQLEYIFHPEDKYYPKMSTATVEQMLSLTMEKIESVASIYSYGRTLQIIQGKLKNFGFTSEDGPFMEIKFPESKSKDKFVEDLVRFKGFSRRDAKIAVEFGLRAGWIKV